MQTDQNMIDFFEFGWVTGVVAAVAAAVGYGELKAKIKTLEERAEAMASVPSTLARLDERTKQIQSDVADVKANFVRKEL